MRFLAFLATLAAVPAQAETVFHFYGALDCPPCMAFKRDHLADVQAAGEAEGFAVAENLIDRTTDVPDHGIYGATDPLLRAALTLADLTPYPPVFFVTVDGAVTSVHGHDWAAARAAAVVAGQEAPSPDR